MFNFNKFRKNFKNKNLQLMGSNYQKYEDDDKRTANKDILDGIPSDKLPENMMNLLPNIDGIDYDIEFTKDNISTFNEISNIDLDNYSSKNDEFNNTIKNMDFKSEDHDDHDDPKFEGINFDLFELDVKSSDNDILSPILGNHSSNDPIFYFIVNNEIYFKNIVLVYWDQVSEEINFNGGVSFNGGVPILIGKLFKIFKLAKKTASTKNEDIIKEVIDYEQNLFYIRSIFINNYFGIFNNSIDLNLLRRPDENLLDIKVINSVDELENLTRPDFFVNTLRDIIDNNSTTLSSDQGIEFLIFNVTNSEEDIINLNFDILNILPLLESENVQALSFQIDNNTYFLADTLYKIINIAEYLELAKSQNITLHSLINKGGSNEDGGSNVDGVCNDDSACNYKKYEVCKYLDCSGICGGDGYIDSKNNCIINYKM